MSLNQPSLEPRFSRKSLNIIIFVTAMMILMFSMLSPDTDELEQSNEGVNSIPPVDQAAPSSQEQGSNEVVVDELSSSLATEKPLSVEQQPVKEVKEVKEKSLTSPAVVNQSEDGFSLAKLGAELESINEVALAVETAPQFKIEHWQSRKGARVYFVNAPEIPMVDVRLVFDAGSARDGRLPGLSNLTNALLSQGTENYPVEDLLAAFEDSGIQFSYSAYRDMAIVGFRVLAMDRYLEKAVKLVAEVVGKPRFPKEHLNRLLSQYKTSLEREQQIPHSLMSKELYTQLYAGHPYGISSNGTKNSLDKIDGRDIKRFYKQYYVAENLVIAMVGAISSEKSKEVAESLTAYLSKGEHAPALPKPEKIRSLTHKHVPFESKQTHIRIATLTIDKLDEDYYPLYVGNYILGGGGFSSILNKEIRQDRGLSYSVGSSIKPMRELGPFSAGLQTQGESAGEALNVVIDTIRQFVEVGPSQEKLDLAKQELTASFPLLASNNASVLGYLSSIGFYGLPLDYLSSFNKKISQVSLDDIKYVFKKYIDPDAFFILTLGAEKPKINASE